MSHLGPPSAPSRTASEAFASAIASSVIATPCGSIAAPPAGCSIELEVGGDGVEDLDGGGGHFGTDPVTGEKGDVRHSCPY